ncbi:H-NS histone family protein (plasmid) [Roseovarius sp. THAF8]|uniref:H-NS histone family protein n=1 Tax=Roseovarius sp. THAF8 TaxID=2587846 RepID=UPI0012A8E01B|nr:H-NS histone family protein [Roseovarius sp. THAF8]QFT99821.1 H-NS histone family protein [Roseovarius sp. THAF8]
MINHQLESLELAELKDIKVYVERLIREKEEEARQRAKAELEERAREMGFNASELFGAEPRKSKKQPTHQNPENPKEKWIYGPGRRPHWIAEYLKKGGKLEDLEIKS